MKAFHILVVEDNPADVVLLTKAFERSRLPYTLSVVQDGQAALDFVRREHGHQDVERPDLVLLDINLPRLNGHEVLYELKRDPRTRPIPVVMLSSSALDSDLERSLNNHANSFIKKPPSLGDLVVAIEQLSAYWFGTVRRTAC